MTALIHARSMGNFVGGEGTSPIAGRCRVCGKPITAGRRYCMTHKWIQAKANAQVRCLCELAEERRVREMIHDWWEAG